jgi:hypothetical protein
MSSRIEIFLNQPLALPIEICLYERIRKEASMETLNEQPKLNDQPKLSDQPEPLNPNVAEQDDAEDTEPTWTRPPQARCDDDEDL